MRRLKLLAIFPLLFLLIAAVSWGAARSGAFGAPLEATPAPPADAVTAALQAVTAAPRVYITSLPATLTPTLAQAAASPPPTFTPEGPGLSFTPTPAYPAQHNPVDRSVPVKALIEKLGGRFIGMYYTFGEYDGFTLYEQADNVASMAGVLAAVAPGHLKAIKTTVLFTVAEAVQAMKKAGSVAFPAPKG